MLLFLGAAVAVGWRVARFRAVRTSLAEHHGQLRVEGVPAWLRQAAGPDVADAFGQVRGVTFRHASSGFPVKLTDDEIVACVELMAGFPELESVFVRSWDPLGDRSLLALRGLRGLRELSILSSDVGNDGVAGIARDLPRLRFLALPGSRIDDDGAAEIAKLVHLESLHLDGTDLGDAGARSLANLPRLEELSLSQTYVTDEGVMFLAERIPNLTVTDD